MFHFLTPLLTHSIRLGIKFYLVSVLLTLVAFLAVRYGYIEEVTDSSKQNLKQSLSKQVVTGFSELKHSRQLRLNKD